MTIIKSRECSALKVKVLRLKKLPRKSRLNMDTHWVKQALTASSLKWKSRLIIPKFTYKSIRMTPGFFIVNFFNISTPYCLYVRHWASICLLNQNTAAVKCKTYSVSKIAVLQDIVTFVRYYQVFPLRLRFLNDVFTERRVNALNWSYCLYL